MNIKLARIGVLYYTSTELAEKNPVLYAGELCYESDTLKYKIGDGETPWNDLEYISTGGSEPITVDTTYTNENPTTITVGGIEKGSTFDSVEMKDMWTKLLYPYVEPKVTSFSFLDSLDPVYEVGGNYTVSSMSIDVSQGSNDLQSVKVSLNDTEVYNSTYQDSLEISFDPITITSDSPTIAVVITLNDGVTELEYSETVQLRSFISPVYYGNTTETPTESDILSSNKLVSNKPSLMLNYTMAGDSAFIAYPSTMGYIYSIIGENGLDYLSTFTKVTDVIVNEVDYTVYISEPATISNYTYTFKFRS